MRKLALDKLDAFFKEISKSQELYLPVKDRMSAAFGRYQEGTTYYEAPNTLRSAKDFFFPQSETMARFRFAQKQIEVVDTRREHEDFVLFGVRPCDVASFRILDTVFLADPVDTYYQMRRSHSTVISLSCTKPRSTCFCSLYGIDATKGGADVDAWKCDDGYYFEANTEKGKKLLDDLGALLEQADETKVEAQRAEVRKVLDKLPFGKLDMHKFGKDAKMLELFNASEWDELSQSCLGCGTCTFVCPTCQCFDIRDFDAGKGNVQRYRCWDSCMYSDFTQMAAANPRHSQKERFRQRFMHKLVYYPEEHQGVYGCVGCGRCLERCPIHMHIVKVIKTLGEDA